MGERLSSAASDNLLALKASNGLLYSRKLCQLCCGAVTFINSSVVISAYRAACAVASACSFSVQ